MAMNRSRDAVASGRCLRLVGSMLGAVAMAGGCESSTPTSPPATAPVAPAPPAASPAAGDRGKNNLDTTSRRQHQKQQAGGASQPK
jgi:hypothetical protein